MTSSIFIHDGIILTNDKLQRIIRNGAIAIENDKIVSIGKTEDLKKDFSRADIKIDARDKIIVPGIINAHTHVMGHVFKGFTDDDVWGTFYPLCLPMESHLSPKNAYWLSLIGCIETLKFGSVLINDIFHYASETAKAVRDIGMRAVLEHKVFDVESLSNLQYMNYTRDYELGLKKLKENEELIKKWNGAADGRIRAWVGNHAPDTNSPELLKAGRALADKYNVGIHIHVAQSQTEVKYIKSEYGKTSVEFLDSLGFLKHDVVCTHLIYATSGDIKILEKTGANMAHCPVIMGKAAAFPRIGELLKSKVRIGIGCDWVTLNPWDEMRAAIEITRALTGDPSLQSAQRAFKMMTLDSAEIFGVANELGSLEVGKKADLLIIDRKKPNLVPMKDILPTLVYNMTGNEIEKVIIDGKIVVDDGRTVMVDEEEAMRKAQELSEEIWEKSGVWPPKETY